MELKASEAEAKKLAKFKTLQEYKLGKIKEAGGLALLVYPENWLENRLLLIRMSKGEI